MIAADIPDTVVDPFVKVFVCNTDVSGMDGSHWFAVAYGLELLIEFENTDIAREPLWRNQLSSRVMASKRKAANATKAAPATRRPAKKAAAPPLAAELTGDVQPPAANKGGYGDFLLSATEPATYTT